MPPLLDGAHDPVDLEEITRRTDETIVMRNLDSLVAAAALHADTRALRSALRTFAAFATRHAQRKGFAFHFFNLGHYYLLNKPQGAARSTDSHYAPFPVSCKVSEIGKAGAYGAGSYF